MEERLKAHTVAPSCTILEAVQCIDRNALHIVLVTDTDHRLLGTVTDGDVRRAILRGVPLAAPVGDIMERSPAVAQVGIGETEAAALLQARRLRHLPVVDGNGVVVALLGLDELISGTRRPNAVLLMAGGLGMRLRPLTETMPKPMIPIGGKPLLQTIIESFIAQGFHNFYISLNYRGEVIREHFGTGEAWGARIRYIEEQERLGTAGCLALLPDRQEHPLLVMNGDILTAVNYQHMLQFHADSGAAATMAAFEQQLHVPYGVLELDGPRLVRVVEKPAHQFYINAGIYILDPEILDHLPATRPYDMPTLFEDLIARGGKAAAFPIREYWRDIGRWTDLELAEAEFPDVFK
ncbi:alcohol dehydrogenase (plasmid) [Azospirillum thermophilum]|uniref:Alcohol dehydrogenase n=2 Tax=Azospirillum thermophilum TaxID=2202148 RepID=A0A2S2D1H8_9PROT|nr:alcohol dehydrogenase [Azospirillum thermophilum]